MLIMPSIDNFSRGKERLWFPLLTELGYTDLNLTSERMDQHNSVDAVGNIGGGMRYFSLRLRDGTRYPVHQTMQYKREFTLRISRPSGSDVEWQKLFKATQEIRPDFLCYGWIDEAGGLKDWVIINLHVLRQYYRDGHMKRYEHNQLRNIDELASVFVYVDIPALCELSIKYWYMNHILAGVSNNHPILNEIIHTLPRYIQKPIYDATHRPVSHQLYNIGLT